MNTWTFLLFGYFEYQYMNICVKVFVWIYIFISFGIYLKVDLVGNVVTLAFNFFTSTELLFLVATLCILPMIYEGSSFIASSTLSITVFFIFAIYGYEVIYLCGFGLHFLNN
jgi:hypothetical protein